MVEDVVENVKGDLKGHFGDICVKVDGNIYGDVEEINKNGYITGSIFGNVAGDVAGRVDGDIAGNVEGDVSGFVGGQIHGSVGGDVSGTVANRVVKGISGDVSGRAPKNKEYHKDQNYSSNHKSTSRGGSSDDNFAEAAVATAVAYSMFND